MHNPSSTLQADRAPGAVPPGAVPRALWIGIAAVAVTAAGIASALAFRGTPAEAPPVTTAAVAPAATATPPAPGGAAVERTREPAPVIDEPAERPTPKPARAATTAHRAAPAEPAPEPVRAAAVCATCGVVESVQAVKQEGQGTGLGAVAGGVLGGVVGHQFGGGSGKKAMTVLGAVGGGVAGHQAEKSLRSTTVYSVRVRMDDGTVRTLTQSQAPAVGARVQVEGSTLRGA